MDSDIKEAAEYGFRAYLLSGGKTHDEVSFDFTLSAPVYLEKLSPNASTPGKSLTIIGSGFGTDKDKVTVTFGEEKADVQTLKTTSVKVVIPEGISSCDVMVEVNGFESNTLPFTLSGAPIIDGFVPSKSKTRGLITIMGKEFGKSNGLVVFNGDTADFISSWSDSEIKVEVPDKASTGDVVVIVKGVKSNEKPFTITPSVFGISPERGPVPAKVTITGYRFGAKQESSTILLEKENAVIESWSDSAIVLYIGVMEEEKIDITLKMGTHSTRVGTYESTGAFAITEIFPDNGPVGTPVLISGVNFGSDRGSVTINRVEAQIIDWNNTSIHIEVGAGTTDGELLVIVPSGDTLPGPKFDVIDSLDLIKACDGIEISLTGYFKYKDQSHDAPTAVHVNNDYQDNTIKKPVRWDGSGFSVKYREIVSPRYNAKDTMETEISGSVTPDGKSVTIKAYERTYIENFSAKYGNRDEIEASNVPIQTLSLTGRPSATFKLEGPSIESHIQYINDYSYTWPGGQPIVVEFSSVEWNNTEFIPVLEVRLFKADSVRAFTNELK